MKALAAEQGRDPDTLTIWPGIALITGETREIALAKDGLLTGLSEARAGLSTLAYHLDIDRGQFPQDEKLTVLDQPGVHGHYKEVAERSGSAGRLKRPRPASLQLHLPLFLLGVHHGERRHVHDAADCGAGSQDMHRTGRTQ